ncbi:hypothetical protein [Janthinobacterium lividum]|uniref:hypothetical protein n=1 Tax=Janthinobacterium lividum TaxID=29581 RepID=UPI000892EA66|nr:hypothetical protein [Janthinobacterium lividum]OEZ52941.1 hypothetical protein JANLI_45980 [Janthinobacterium lividum]WQE29896.1 hypothetical protein U0004_05575 [Janthinobacterium lividum]
MYSFTSPRLAALLAALLLAGATGAAVAAVKGKKPAGLERYGVAVYSDLCLQKDSGEIGGQRVTLLLISKKCEKEKVNCVVSGRRKLDFGQCVVF